MPFTFTRLQIPDVVLIEPKIFSDDRGFFIETYKAVDFRDYGITSAFLQDNYSYSKAGVLRGLHYQLQPFAQGKLVQVIKGKVFDVAVDIRRNSPTYKQWVGLELSNENHYMLWIPPGFAHGFVALEEDTHFLYKVTKEYSAEHDRSIRWNDPAIDIPWPLNNPVLSAKDRVAPLLAEAENNF